MPEQMQSDSLKKSIKFFDFSITMGEIHFKCLKSGEEVDDLYFKFSHKVIPSNDLISIALSTLCGKEYECIEMDLVVSRDALQKIEQFTKAEVSFTDVNEKIKQNNIKNEERAIALSFSGGFDSFAAYCVMPDDTKLVSLDFGHWFQREADFFMQFKPYTVQTNFRRLKYDRASWTFMGVAAILYSDFLNINYHAFGSIFDQNIENFLRNKQDNTYSNYSESFFQHTDMIDVSSFARGLTEVVTVMIVCFYKPEMVKDSLKSLAAQGSEKLYRKSVLVDIVCTRYNLKIDYEMPDTVKYPIKSPYEFGDFILADFLALYVIKHRGIDAASKTVTGIPSEAVVFVNNLSLDFYEKLNPAFIMDIPIIFRSQYLDKLKNAGVTPYSDKDWDEFYIVRDFISKYNKKLKKALNNE